MTQPPALATDTPARPGHEPAPENPTGSQTSAGEPGPPRLRHRNCLDGIRGIAVLIVVLFHLDLGWMKGGYLGVDIFFVLSGFLITTLLVQEWAANGRIDLKRFWIRRARRLLPAMLVVLGGVAVFAVFFAEPEQLDDIRTQGLASLFYVTNWARAFDATSYFDQFAAKSPLEHYWSLAIEEQFYLVWPAITVALFSWRARAAGPLNRARRYDVPLWLVGAVGATASAGLMALLYTPDNSSLYFRTDTRVQGLLVGVALAALYDGLGTRLVSSPPKWLVPAGWVAAALFMLGAVVDVLPALLYQGGFLVIAVLTAIVIVAAMVGQQSSLDRALSLRPFRFLGRISYGLYLWHWPIILALTPQRTGLSLPWLTVLRFGLSLGAAVLSLRLLEIPIRERRMPIKFELASIGAVPVLVAVALIATTTGGEPTLEEAYADDQEAAAPPTETIEAIKPPAALSTLVLGDELAQSLPDDWGGPDPAGDGAESNAVTLAGSGCDDASTLCDDWQDRWKARVDEADPDIVVVGIRSWEAFDDANTQLDVFDSAKTERAYTDGIDQLVRRLGAGPTDEGGRTVVLLTAPPINDTHSFDAFAVERSREAAQQVATRSNGAVEHVPIEGLWCGQVRCVDSARLNPAKGEFTLISPNPDAFGSALAGVARRSVRRHLTQEATGGQLRVLLLGDSVAWSIGSNFFGDTDARSAPILLWNRAEFSCYPDPAPGRRLGLPGKVITECPDWAERWPTYAEEFAPDIVLVPVSQWMIVDREVDGRTVAFDSVEMRQRIEKYYGETIDVLSDEGSLVVLATVIPNVESVNTASIEEHLEETQRREVALNRIVTELVASRSEDAALLDLAGWICDGTDCAETLDGTRLRPDGGHFTPQSSPLAGAFLSDELQRIAEERGLGPDAATTNPAAGPDRSAADVEN